MGTASSPCKRRDFNDDNANCTKCGWPAWKHRDKPTTKDDLEMANGCLDMVRETLESLGLKMDGCPPMMYNDAVRQLAQILGRKAGLKTWAGIAGVVAEHEAAKSGGSAPPAGEP